MANVQVDKDVRTGNGLSMMTVRWYRTMRARLAAESYYRRLGLDIRDLDRQDDNHPYGFVAMHPRYEDMMLWR